MNAQAAKQEGLTVVQGAFERKEGTGSAFPQYDGSVKGDFRVDGRLYDMEVTRQKNGSVVVNSQHGNQKAKFKVKSDDGWMTNDKAPRWKGDVEIADKEYQVAIWLSFTKNDTRYLSFSFREVVAVDDSGMDIFDDDKQVKASSFIDDMRNDSTDGARDNCDDIALKEALELSGRE